MFGLPALEITLFSLVVAAYLLAAIAGALQLLRGGQRYAQLLTPLVVAAIALEIVILILRTIAIETIPLTGLFESMVMLTIVFAGLYLALSAAIRQVWFGSVMVWIIFAMILMAAAVARPASEPHAVAATPWAVAHGVAMILGGASIAWGAASGFLYLLGRRSLKRKKVMQVLDRVPNIEKLERMNLFGVQAAFVLITVGLIGGLGLAWVRMAVLEIPVIEWLTDGKVLFIIAAWILLGLLLALNRVLLLSGRARAYMTIVTFVLVLIAILGVTIVGATLHDFSG